MGTNSERLRQVLEESYQEYLKSQKSKDELRSYYQVHKVRFFHLLKKINSILEKKPKSKILDIGIYPPFLALALKKLGAEVEGISSPLEDSNYPSIKTKQLNVEIEKLPYNSDSFDVIVFTEILEHLYRSPKVVLTEIKRVLKPGGSLILTTPNVTRLFNRVKIVLGKPINQEVDYYTEHFELDELYFRHNREYTLAEVKHLLTKFGFKLGEATFFNSYTPDRHDERSVVEQIVKTVYFLTTNLWPSWQDTLYLQAIK